MLPSSSLPSIAEKVQAHRYRERKFSEDNTLEAERSAKFGRFSTKFNVPDYGDLLLGPEFHAECDRLAHEDSSERNTDSQLEPDKFENERDGGGSEHRISNSGQPIVRDWTTRQLPPATLSKIDSIKSICISVPGARGGMHQVLLCDRTVDRIRGGSRENGAAADGRLVLNWLEDNVIDGFASLINSRSQEKGKGGLRLHKPSKSRDIFCRPSVRTFIFSSQLYTIWKRAQNGGYEGIKRWRRKVPEYNSVGMFMFPAFVNQNHWVLAIVDVDGEQLIYYDPQMRDDTYSVMQCAREWIAGEIQTAEKGDAFEGLQSSSWPILYNPWRSPAQMDSQSCGVFVLYVAEHLERGVFPQFSQSDIPVMRQRMLYILQQGKIDDVIDNACVPECQTD